MSKKGHKVFIYGTLLGDDSRPNIYGRRVNIMSARYASVKGRLFVLGVPFMVLDEEVEVEAGGVVHGKVFEIDDDTLMEYDSIEGVYPAKSDGVYERRKVMAKYDDGTEEEVWIYCRRSYEGGELVQNGQFDDWKDDGLCPIPEDRLVKR